MIFYGILLQIFYFIYLFFNFIISHFTHSDTFYSTPPFFPSFYLTIIVEQELNNILVLIILKKLHGLTTYKQEIIMFTYILLKVKYQSCLWLLIHIFLLHSVCDKLYISEDVCVVSAFL